MRLTAIRRTAMRLTATRRTATNLTPTLVEYLRAYRAIHTELSTTAQLFIR